MRMKQFQYKGKFYTMWEHYFFTLEQHCKDFGEVLDHSDWGGAAVRELKRKPKHYVVLEDLLSCHEQTRQQNR